MEYIFFEGLILWFLMKKSDYHRDLLLLQLYLAAPCSPCSLGLGPRFNLCRNIALEVEKYAKYWNPLRGFIIDWISGKYSLGGPCKWKLCCCFTKFNCSSLAHENHFKTTSHCFWLPVNQFIFLSVLVSLSFFSVLHVFPV